MIPVSLVINTVELRERLLDPLGCFDTMPEPVIEMLRLWAERLPEQEVSPTDLMTSYYVLLEDVQTGVDHRTGEPLRSWLTAHAQLHPWLFSVFPYLLLPLLGEAQAGEVRQIWTLSLNEIQKELTAGVD